jgi:predicted 3-demethylubiquinone-9 3-methyltransferase (glyoxalase superfamily)
MTVEFELLGYRFTGLNGGPHFRFTPAISFFVTRESEAEVDHLWEGLGEGGTVMMPLDRYRSRFWSGAGTSPDRPLLGPAHPRW